MKFSEFLKNVQWTGMDTSVMTTAEVKDALSFYPTLLEVVYNAKALSNCLIAAGLNDGVLCVALKASLDELEK